MTKKQRVTLAKKLYIAGDTIESIAKTLGVSPRTVQNYKTKEWDKERSLFLLNQGGQKLHENFFENMQSFLKELKDSDLKPEIKAEKISQIGDAFAKMQKVARAEDPELYRIGIIKHTIKTLILNAKKTLNQECLEQLINLIEQTQEDLADVSI